MNTLVKTNWTKCCLCQQHNKEGLKSPEGNPRMRECDGYSKLAENIPVFYSANAMPMIWHGGI